MYIFLSICKQDPNLFISFTFYLGDGARRVVFEGCFQTLASNEIKLTSKANINCYVQGGLFYFSVAFSKFYQTIFETDCSYTLDLPSAECVCVGQPLQAPLSK